jgi:tetratricopeptide (TPR) repeat protein
MNTNQFEKSKTNKHPVNSQGLSFQELRQMASFKVKQGNYTDAIAILTHLLSQNSRSSIDYNNRGLIYFKSGQYALALKDYNQAILLNPRLDNAYNNRANYYISVGNLGAALKDYQNALNYNPTSFRALLNQGITYRELGLYDLALENFDLGLLLSESLKYRFYAERGQTYHLRGDWNSAIADYQRALLQPSFNSSPSVYRQKVLEWLSTLQPNHSLKNYDS